MRACFLLGALLWAGILRTHGAEPVLTHIHPAGLAQGTTATVKLAGKFEPWPCKIWCGDPGIGFTPAKEAGTFEVTTAAGVKTGPHLFRAFNDEGASAPVALVVASVPQTLEVEPNDDFRSPQVIASTTATINGRLDKTDDVDSFRVTLQKGQTMVAWVDACVLAAGVDAMLRLTDAGGVTLAFNHDHTTMDPFLVFAAPQDGSYVIQTMGQKYPASSDIRFAGGDDGVYRLHLSTGPVVRNTWPLAVPHGKKSPALLEGWNLAAAQVEIDDTAPPGFPVIFSEVSELTETTEPQVLPVPSAISGRIDAAGDEDRFTFTTTKGNKLELSATGASLGSAIDPWLKIFGEDGKELAVNDDEGGSSEPRIVWEAPADGTYAVALGDLTQRGGDDFFYRLLLDRAAPAVKASIASHSAKMEAGKTAELKVAVTLIHGFSSKLKLAARNLPPGVAANEVDVPEKGGETALTLTAEPTAPPASQPFQLVLREVEGGKEHPVSYSMASTAEDNGVPKGYRQLLVNATGQLWITVIPPAPVPPVPPAQ